VIKLTPRPESASHVQPGTPTSIATPTLPPHSTSDSSNPLYTGNPNHVRPIPTQRPNVKKKLKWLGTASFSVFVFSCVLSGDRLSGDKLRLFVRFFTTAVVIFIYALFYMVLLLFRRWPLTKPLAEAIGIQGKNVWLELNNFLFLQLNFVGLLTYYTMMYDSEGTIKPAWTNRLG
jgi:hypothetical protein